ncbi:CaiB/BaiF CoA transferase family protein [Jannaschia ovalis]|uniref:CoA transferase n=1 Tax=Jannaschia ovalis TaxID=3038773 RepID=A0ABY8L897_9RHOB|nr:CoA transferase [Jannaschia sp. GRR-S6-38]WGH77311.1 CoA transferase [Jannaschia sp. GRR-S6-38]
MRRPLDGLRVLDFTHVISGPFATYQLGLMGAEVIRVERPAGDDFVRTHGGTEPMRAAGLGASFLSQNAGKRSVALDLKTGDGRAAALRLAATADIVVENFRPGVADRLGIGFDAIRAARPDVIFASLTGFGPDGPLSDRPAYDHILQGISGLMAMTGTPESGPVRSGIPIVDYVAGQALVTAVLAALLNRRDEAQRVEVSMLEALLAFMGPQAVHQETTGAIRGLAGNAAFSDSPFSGRFACAEGEIVVTANTPAQVVRCATALGRPDLADAPAETVADALPDLFAADTADGWEARLAAAQVPAARVRSLPEMLAHPQMADSPCWARIDVPPIGASVRVPTLPFRAPWTRPPGRVPTLGEDTEAVLAETLEGAPT